MPWDNWLARVLAASQGQLGEGWLNAYLTSPPWRFAIDPDLLGADGWLGVMLSSVDSVHRSFPLTLAAASRARFTIFESRFDSDDWMTRAETLALALIDGGGNVEASFVQFRDLASEIADWQEGPSFANAASAAPISAVTYELPAAPLEGAEATTSDAVSYWWHGDWPGHPAIALCSHGLPDPAVCAGFFDAHWFERGDLSPPPSGLS